MSNRFKSLDYLFPCGANRMAGEVVSTSISFTVNGAFVTSLQWKRKSVWVNASVNAFHMHRGLCREFSNENSWVEQNRIRKLKTLIGDIVQINYLLNFLYNEQYQNCTVELSDLSVIFDGHSDTVYLPALIFALDQAAQRKLDRSVVSSLNWELKPYNWIKT